MFELKPSGNPPAGPDVPPNAIGCGPPGQELGQAGELCGREPARGAGGWTVAPGIWAPLAGTLHPLTDRAFADAERFGDLALGPALRLEGPGLHASGCFPAVWGGVQAWQSTTGSPTL
jgi:hypothetical protein